MLDHVLVDVATTVHLEGGGEDIILYLVYSIKRLPTPKINKLQSPKLRLTQSLLVATFTQNFMRFRWTVMEISSIPRYLV